MCYEEVLGECLGVVGWCAVGGQLETSNSWIPCTCWQVGRLAVEEEVTAGGLGSEAAVRVQRWPHK